MVKAIKIDEEISEAPDSIMDDWPKLVATLVPSIFILAVNYNFIYGTGIGIGLANIYTIQDHLEEAVLVGAIAFLSFIFYGVVITVFQLLFYRINILGSITETFYVLLHSRFVLIIISAVITIHNVCLYLQPLKIINSTGQISEWVVFVIAIGSAYSKAPLISRTRIFISPFLFIMMSTIIMAEQTASSDLTKSAPLFNFEYNGVVREGVLLRGLDKAVIVRLPELHELALIGWDHFNIASFKSVDKSQSGENQLNSPWIWNIQTTDTSFILSAAQNRYNLLAILPTLSAIQLNGPVGLRRSGPHTTRP